MHLYNLTPEAMAVIIAAAMAAAVLVAFFLVRRFRRVNDGSAVWDNPVLCAWHCQDCGATGTLVANNYNDAKDQATRLHYQALAETAPTLLRKCIHNVLVTQET